MFKNKIINTIVGISLFVSVLYLLGKYNPISMEFLINQHGLIQDYIIANQVLSVFLCTLIIALMISIMGPITPVCILAGFYFGIYIGLIIAIIGEVIGAMVVFVYARYFFKEYILRQFGSRFDKFKEGFNRNAISYLLFIRVIGGVPFGIQNLLPAVLDMKLRDYFIATIFGVIIGVLFSLYIENIRSFLSQIFDISLFPEEIYFLSKMPSEINIKSIILISFCSILATTIVSIFPARKASKLNPIKALKYE